MMRKSLLIGCVCLCLAPLAYAQSSARKDNGARQPSEQEILQRAIARCKANRGVDCETPQGLEEWVRLERPLTPEEQAAAVAGARRQRELCQKNKNGPGC